MLVQISPGGSLGTLARVSTYGAADRGLDAPDVCEVFVTTGFRIGLLGDEGAVLIVVVVVVVAEVVATFAAGSATKAVADLAHDDKGMIGGEVENG